MLDVLTHLRDAAERTSPPSPFDLQAAVRGGEVRMRRRRGAVVGVGAAVTVSLIVAGVVTADLPQSSVSAPAGSATVVPRQLTWAERYDISSSLRDRVQAALVGSPAAGADIGLPALTGPEEDPGSAWNLNLEASRVEVSYARSVGSISGWFSKCPVDGDRVGSFEVGTTSCTVSVDGDRVIVQAVDRLPIPLPVGTTGGGAATAVGVRSVHIMDDGAAVIVSSVASHGGDPDDERLYSFNHGTLLSIASAIADEMGAVGPTSSPTP